MAKRLGQINMTTGGHTYLGLLPPVVRFGAYAALALILFLSVGTISIVYLRADFGRAISAADWAALRFTILQAVLSAAFSILLAIPLARAMARRQFRGRSLLLTLLGAPFILPVIVAVLGLLAVFGRAGIFNQALGIAGFEPISIYGLGGVVLAHVFFNMPLATRFLLQGWLAVPSERFRLAASLDFRPFDVFMHIEWPMLRAAVPRAFVLIFLVCLSSFAVALILGGGPKATTIELAIYQAFSFEFDLARAARLAILQVAIGVIAGLVALFLTLPDAFGAGLDRQVLRWDAMGVLPRILDTLAIVLATLFLVTPLVMIAIRGLPDLVFLDPSVFWAAGRSLVVALASIALMLGTALPLAIWASRRGGWVVEGAGLLLVCASPLVVGTGLFLVIFPFFDPAALALPVTALVNGAAALPFALRVLVPAVARVDQDFGRLAVAVGMTPFDRIRLVTLPRIRGPLAFSCGLTGALSMGDLGVITLFAGSDAPTLPLMIYRLMGAYRMDAAAGAALLLLLLSLGVFWAFEKVGRANA